MFRCGTCGHGKRRAPARVACPDHHRRSRSDSAFAFSPVATLFSGGARDRAARAPGMVESSDSDASPHGSGPTTSTTLTALARCVDATTSKTTVSPPIAHTPRHARAPAAARAPWTCAERRSCWRTPGDAVAEARGAPKAGVV